MSDFDPYLKWLGIRENNRPINHYRLLGLELFENDPDVISSAADRQTTHIRTYQNGPGGDLSQQILNELARARRCLLSENKKADYDAELKAMIRQSSPPPMAVSPVEHPTAIAIIEASSVEREPIPIVQPILVASASDLAVHEIQSKSGAQSSISIRTDGDARSKSRKRESKQLMWSLFAWISGGLAAVGVAAALIGSGIIGPHPTSGKSNSPASDPVTTPGAPADADPQPQSIR